MTILTEKQFIKAVGKLDHGSELLQEFLEDHPLEYTDEWIYEWHKFLANRNVIQTHGFNCGGHGRGLDEESERFYGQAKYMEDHREE